MAETKAAFRRRVGRLLNILSTATASGGSTTTFVAAEFLDRFPSDDLLNNSFYIYDVADSAARRVTDWDAPTFTGTVNRAFANAIANDDDLELYAHWSPSDIDNALEAALDEVYPYIAAQVVDTSLAAVAEQYEYTVPSTIRDLERMLGGKVESEIDTDVTTYPYHEHRTWTTRDARTNAGNLTLIIHPSELPTAGRTLRLTGLGILSNPSTDATSISLSSDTLRLLAWKVAEILYRDFTAIDTARDQATSDSRAARYRALYEQNKDVMGIILDPTAMQDLNFGSGLPEKDLAQNTPVAG